MFSVSRAKAALSLAATMTTLYQAAAGNQPGESYLAIQPPHVTGSLQLTLYGYPGSSNQIQFSQKPGNGTWSVLTNFSMAGTLATVSDLGVSSNAARFYRAVLRTAPWPTVSSNYVWIPAGQFLMGSPSTEQDRNTDEGPQTMVTLSRGFYMGKYLVTQGEYMSIMGNNPSYFTGDTNRPVESCGWFNATNYCAQLTALEYQAGRLPPGWNYRLPTEAEWEYACRAGTTTRFSYGDDPGYTNLTNYAWYDGNSYTTSQPSGAYYLVGGRYYTTHPVGQKLPNQWGLYDIYGDVSEWCQDWFDFYPGASVIDPRGPPAGPDESERVLRSGSWLDDPYTLRSAFRYSADPGNVSGLYGFRVVLAVVQP
jgi:formylglycine-generating enzyme required for sulfatase activity